MDINEHDIDSFVPNYEMCLKLHDTGFFNRSKLAVKIIDQEIYYFDREAIDDVCAPMLSEIFQALFLMLGNKNIHFTLNIFGEKCNSVWVETLNQYFLNNKNILSNCSGNKNFFASVCELVLDVNEKIDKF